ncbi:MAG TPA: AAA family ATPase [Desulfatiglandales bacterium]|nr:AAA family ATPase [Desulfatiglandales bacterium]
MYTSFYNLKEKPFNLTPSPRFLYLGETHKEALSLLTYGVMERKGFILLTGEVGTGKTTIVQTLLSDLDSSVKYVSLSNPTLSAKDFLFYVASGLGLKTQFESKGSFLIQFENFLQTLLHQQQNVLLIVDEAQKLSLTLLEEIRLLSNMETADEKLINIFLVGQPELNQKLRHPECRPLLQRISIRYHINPLHVTETEAYIKTRLKLAGARDTKIFSKKVIRVIHSYARGYPRMINILCDNALLLGYSNGKKHITVEMIEECYNDLQLPESFLQKDIDIQIKREPEAPESVKKRTYLRAAVLIILLFILISAGSVTSLGQRYLKTAELFYKAHFISKPPPLKEKSSVIVQEKGLPPSNVEGKKIGTKPGVEITKAGIKENLPIPKASSPKGKLLEKSKLLKGDLLAKKENVLKIKNEILTVKPGDTLLGLAMEMYGYADKKTLNQIQRENPEIRDVNLIEIGQKILFSKPPFRNNTYRSIYSVHIASFKPLESARSVFERMIKGGFEPYILPFDHPEKGKMFRIAVGAFKDKVSAKYYGKKLLDMGVVEYAEPISIDIM